MIDKYRMAKSNLRWSYSQSMIKMRSQGRGVQSQRGVPRKVRGELPILATLRGGFRVGTFRACIQKKSNFRIHRLFCRMLISLLLI